MLTLSHSPPQALTPFPTHLLTLSLLASMQYESVEQGMEATLSLYMQLLLERMVGEMGLEVWVHPVPPVLNETRAMVVKFQAALRKKVGGVLVCACLCVCVCVCVLVRVCGGGCACCLLQLWLSLLHSEKYCTISGLTALWQVLAAAASPAAKGRLHLLDFFEDMLAPCTAQTEGTATSGGERGERAGVAGGEEGLPKLRPEFEFDGTHLSPAYVRLLERALGAEVA